MTGGDRESQIAQLFIAWRTDMIRYGKWTFLPLLLAACFLSFAYTAGCQSVYAQGVYARVSQVRLASLPDAPQTEIKALIDANSDPVARGQALWTKGGELEAHDDFAAALAAYDEITRTHAQPPAGFTDHLHWCQARMTLAHRWDDADLRKAAQKMDLDTGLGLYREVARTVADNYVDKIGYGELFADGVVNLQAAMTSPEFLKQLNVTADQAKREAFTKALDQINREVQKETDLSSFAARRYVRQICQASDSTVGLPCGVIVSEFIFGAAEHLDPYSTYMTHRMYEDLKDDIGGKFVGLGVEIREEEGRLLIVTVFEGGPAFKAGLLAGDVLLKADGVEFTSNRLHDAVKVLRGQRGTPVTVTVRRNQETRTCTVIREDIEVPSVRSAARVGPDKAYGYIAVTGFQRSTASETSAAIEQLGRQGPLAGLVLDLRGNPGGLLESAVEVCSLFLDKGTVLTTKGRGFGQSQTFRVSHWRYASHDMPLVILINGHSASASEIVVSALHDHERATLVGARTYGKGVVQSILPVEAGQSSVYLTTARFYGPNDESFHGLGIAPDYPVAAAEKPFLRSAQPDSETDPVLAKALEVLGSRHPQPAVAQTLPLAAITAP
jgi:carboxyl-terminal processing protease